MIYSEDYNKIKLLLGGGRKVSMQQVIEAQIAENEARKSKQERASKKCRESCLMKRLLDICVERD